MDINKNQLDTDNYNYKDVPMTVKHHRNRYSCDVCKLDKNKYKHELPTECFIGFCGNVLWICDDCFKKLKQKHSGEIEVPEYDKIQRALKNMRKLKNG